jgi:ABC-type amino acid transport system permease subunit
MLTELVMIIVSVIISALFIWLFYPVLYYIYVSINSAFAPLVKSEDTPFFNQINELYYNLVRGIPLILLGAVLYFIWIVMQRRRAEDIVS